MSHASTTSGFHPGFPIRYKQPLQVSWADECCDSELQPDQIHINFAQHPACSMYYKSPSDESRDSVPQPAHKSVFSKFRKCKHGSKCKNPDCIFVHDETALNDPELTLDFALKCQRAAAKNYQKLEVEKTKSTQLELDIECHKREIITLKHQLWTMSQLFKVQQPRAASVASGSRRV